MNRPEHAAAPSTPPGADPEARFRAFYADAYADVLRFVRRRTPPDRAEDVVAEAFLVAWRRIDDLPDDRGDARAWLFGIARGCLLNDRRAQGRRAALAVRLAEATWPEAAPDLATDPQFVADRLDVAAAWQRLSPADQEVIALAVLDGLTSAQAGAVLGVTAVAYRLRLSRARAALRRLLDAPHRGSALITPEMTP